MTLEEAITELKDTDISPGRLSELHLWLANEYASVNALFGDLVMKRALE